ncbi:hydrolase GDSL [Opitutaceae bacterium TAV5]|nr:hydrolase GDSL [Opitutaceae bacterium TAV5]
MIRIARILSSLACILSVMPTTLPASTAAGSAVLPTVADVARRAENREPLSIVFLGGSLTWGANASDPNRTSYRGRMMQWLRETYPRTPITFHDAAIGGTGSALALFRIDRDVLPHKPDLVFLDFTVNDGITGADEQNLASYERVLRDLRGSGAAVLPVLMCMHGQITAPAGSPLPARYAAHGELATAYGLVAADTLAAARAAVAAGRADPAQLYSIGNDRTHPDDSGYALFFEAVRDAWIKAAATTAASPVPDRTLHADLYSRRDRHILVDTPLPAGWERAKTYRTTMWFDGLSSRWMGDVARAGSADAAPLEITFRGSMVGLFGESNPLTPPFRVWIDGKPLPQPGSRAADPYLWNISTARFGSPAAGAANLFAWTLLTRALPDGEHVLKIAPDFTGAAPGAELRIESVCAAGR